MVNFDDDDDDNVTLGNNPYQFQIPPKNLRRFIH